MVQRQKKVRMVDNQENTGRKVIFLIENQYDHFEKIWERLNEKYEVYPKKDKSNNKGEAYKEIINLVRVYLNPRYGIDNPEKRRGIALEKLLGTIDTWKPDLFIIDYVLVGNYFGETGLDLAKKLREKHKQPIVFLSNSKKNKAEIIAKYAELTEPKQWIYKGFAGEKVLEKDSFKEHILPEIEAILKQNVKKIISEEIEKVEKKLEKYYKTYDDLYGDHPSESKAIKPGLDRLLLLKVWLKEHKNKIGSTDEFNKLFMVLDDEGIFSDKIKRLCDEILN